MATDTEVPTGTDTLTDSNASTGVADHISSYVKRAYNLATQVSTCRTLFSSLNGSYSTCSFTNLHINSSCPIRTSICDRKMRLYNTGSIDFGGDRAERNEVTEEWEGFLRRISRIN